MPPRIPDAMVKICSYSTLILSGNIIVLLVVAVTTDYWQYRGFNHHNITVFLHERDGVEVIRPRDTFTYLLVTTMMTSTRRNVSLIGHYVHYHSPMLVKIFHNGTVDKNGAMMDVVQVFLFIQYGNLFRDCENLEEGVRKRLGLDQLRPEKCVVFLSSEPPFSNQTMHNPDTVRVEVASLCTAILSILCLTVSLAAGSLGSLSKSHRYMTIASATSLLAAIVLITSIALFNGKTHLQWRDEPLPYLKFPHKDVLIENKTRIFGWSFVLAWTCVGMMFTSSFTWLYKAEHLLVPEENEYIQLYEASQTQARSSKRNTRNSPDDDGEQFALVEYTL